MKSDHRLVLHHRRGGKGGLREFAQECGIAKGEWRSQGITHQIIGCPPIQYLTRWRMQIIGRKLTESSGKMAAVAEAAGPSSEKRASPRSIDAPASADDLLNRA